MWNIKKRKQSKQNKTPDSDTENRLVVARGREWRREKWVKKVKRYKFAFIK